MYGRCSVTEMRLRRYTRSSECDKISCCFFRKVLNMINFKDEINRFKPSLEVGDIEKAIAKSDLTDMSDIMMQLIKEAAFNEGDAPLQRTNERL